MLRFYTLGAVDLRGPDGEDRLASAAQPKRLAILAYLAVAATPAFHRRDTLVALFWPELSQERARSALRKALHYLRTALGADIVIARGDEEVRVDGALWCDARELAVLASQQRHEEALTLYRGEFLPGLHVAGTPEFEHWLDGERRRLQSTALGCSVALARSEGTGSSAATRVSWARRAVEIAPLEEVPNRLLIECLIAASDRPGAIAAYDRFAERLAAEMDVSPDKETRRLVDGLRGSTTSRASIAARTLAPRRTHGVPGSNADSAVHVVSSSHNPINLSAGSASPVGVGSERIPSRGGGRTRTAAAAAAALLILPLVVISLARRPSHSMEPARRQLTFAANAVMGTLSPDRKFLAYATLNDKRQSVVVQDMSGGAPDTIANLFTVQTLEWSPDGENLLVGTGRGEGGAVVVPRLGGSLRRIPPAASFGSVAHAYWLPNGNKVSLHDYEDHRILVVDLPTADSLSVPIRGNYVWVNEGSWSPSGRLFAVMTESINPIRWTIRIVSLDGHAEVAVEDSVLIGSPRWSDDGRVLYFARGSEELWSIRVSPSTGQPQGAPEQVQRSLEMVITRYGLLHFGLTGDARHAVYPRGLRTSNLFLVEAADSGKLGTQLTRGSALRWSPIVSPDGRWIAFVERTSGTADLYRMPIAGGTAERITFGANVWPDSKIAWSPDGQQLAFETLRGGNAQVWIASLKTGALRPLAATRMSTATGHLTWAPGSAIAYQSPGHHTLGLVDPVTGDQRFLRIDSDSMGFMMSPQYSPDGKALIFAGGPVNDRALWRLNLRDSTRVKIGSAVVWPRGLSTDGRFVYAQVFFGPVIYRFDTSKSGAPERLFTAPFREADCTPAGAMRPHAFVCAAFNFESDIWAIDLEPPRRRWLRWW